MARASTAEIVILAGNGYLAGIDRGLEARVMPIANYILATEPIGAGQPGGLIPNGEAVSDTRFVVYYFRPSADGRLVFGGGETYSRRPPADVAAFVRRHMRRIYPQLADTRVDYAWGGTLAITLPGCPSSAACGRASSRRPGSPARAWRSRLSPARCWPKRSPAIRRGSTASPPSRTRPFPAANGCAIRPSPPA